MIRLSDCIYLLQVHQLPGSSSEYLTGDSITFQGDLPNFGILQSSNFWQKLLNLNFINSIQLINITNKIFITSQLILYSFHIDYSIILSVLSLFKEPLPMVTTYNSFFIFYTLIYHRNFKGITGHSMKDDFNLEYCVFHRTAFWAFLISHIGYVKLSK